MTVDPSPTAGGAGLVFDPARVGQPIDDPVRRNEFFEAMESFLTGYASQDPPIPTPLVATYNPDYSDEGLDWPTTALTMVGRRRLRNFRTLIEQVVRDDVPGDIIEAGVWRGARRSWREPFWPRSVWTTGG
jgi:hypothetical protein